jgi:hypothetical protein
MSLTKITTPELLDFPNNSTSSINTSGTVIPKGLQGISVHYLIVGGGAGGGSSWANNHGGSGGGGAGGYITNYSSDPIYLTPSTNYPIDVGDGGAAGVVSGGSGTGQGVNGGNSVFASLIAVGGGGGAGEDEKGEDGGSGGGSGNSRPTQGKEGFSIPLQGNNGGSNTYANGAGGGGGAGSVGANASSYNGGNGGSGLQNNIDGLNSFYAAGGGGGAYQSNTAGTGGSGIGGDGGSGNPGGDATGIGSGGGGTDGYVTARSGGDGYKGIVILRVASTTTATFSAGVTSALTQVGGGTWTSGDKIYTITNTSSGSETVNFTSTISNFTPTTSLSAGEFRLNTSTSLIEYSPGTGWIPLVDEYITGQPSTCVCNFPTTATALYQFNDNVNDTCGNYNGIASNLDPYVTGKFGKAASFNGSSSVIDISSSTINVGTPYTISMWLNFSDVTAYKGVFANITSSRLTNEIAVVLNSGKITIYSVVSNGNTNLDAINATPQSAIANNTWYNVVIVADRSLSNKAKVYFNSVEASYTYSAGVAGTAAYSNTKIGLADGQYFDGLMDQIRLFNSVLTTSQITELYNEVVCN